MVSLQSGSRNFNAFSVHHTSYYWVSALSPWSGIQNRTVLEMCVVQWLTLVLSDGSNQVPFSPENRQQIQSPRHILFRIPQCTEFTNPVTLNILLSESFRTEVNITLCSSLRYFHVAGDNIFVFLVKKFSLAYTSTNTFIYNVFNFYFNSSQANLTVTFNTSKIFLRIMFIQNLFIPKKPQVKFHHPLSISGDLLFPPVKIHLPVQQAKGYFSMYTVWHATFISWNVCIIK